MQRIENAFQCMTREDVVVNVVVKDKSIWPTQKAMAELSGVQVPTINKHLKNIFAEGGLVEEAAVSKMEITTRCHGWQNTNPRKQILQLRRYHLCGPSRELTPRVALNQAEQ